MVSLKNTPIYRDILKEINYPFGDVFIFDGYVVSEIKEGTIFSWEEHAKQISEDVTQFTKSDGGDLIYLSHRIYSYSVLPVDWIKFYRNSFNLKGYGVIGYNSLSFLNTVIENMFFNKKIRRFNSLDSAVQWAKSKVLADLESL